MSFFIEISCIFNEVYDAPKIFNIFISFDTNFTTTVHWQKVYNYYSFLTVTIE